MSPYGFLPIQPTFSLPHIFQPEPTSPWAQLSAAQASTVFQIPDCHGKQGLRLSNHTECFTDLGKLNLTMVVAPAASKMKLATKAVKIDSK
jgi:hypothetical protein